MKPTVSIKHSIKPGYALLIASLLLAGCASAPKPPTQALQAAELAITSAEQARVADYASLELNNARQKLVSANTAVDAREMELALQLAEESRVNAELASARAEMMKARDINEEMQKSIDTLKQEMQRNTGVR
jgi:putative cell wall-binding protein